MRIYSLFGLVALLSLIVASCSSGSAEPTATSTAATVTTTSISESPATSTPPSGPTTTETPPTTLPIGELKVMLNEVGSGFEAPVLVVAVPEGGPDLVVEQSGRIVRLDDHGVLLDIREDVRWDGEQGLLGLAFHPDFNTNRLAYVNYVDTSGQTIIEQFEVRDGLFGTSTRRVILEAEQPARNHNGGMIAFGPLGHLWIGMGDGGASNDKFRNGQNPDTLLGAMLRISVPGATGAPYDIPELNPFADGEDGAPEVYAMGVRNPWRFSFDFFEDGQNADLWVADVGQNEIEEINVVPTSVRGANYGWPIMEASSCFTEEGCDQADLIMPIIEYSHDEGCSVTGGYVYRGTAIPELDGHYFYSDYCTGFLRSYSPVTGDHDWTEQVGTIAQVSGFGIGGDGEMYVVSLTGSIHRIERTG